MTLHRLLASPLHTRYEWTGDQAALTEAMEAAEAAVCEADTGTDRALALSVRPTMRSTAARLNNDRTPRRGGAPRHGSCHRQAAG